MAVDAPRPRSLRLRVMLISLLWMAAALVATGYVLNQLFEEHVRAQYQRQLQVYADYVLADIGPNNRGKPHVQRPPQNPRLLQPLSGLYWQLNDEAGRAVLRSRSLWDQVLQTPHDSLGDNQTHFHLELGPGDQSVLLLEQPVRFEWDPDRQWRLLVAEDSGALMGSIAQWQRSLVLFLSVLFVGLLAAVMAQTVFGLSPLRRLQRAVTALRQGQATRLEGQYPTEFTPLVEDFNDVLRANETMMERARAQAGDLAHAIKTPVTIMTNAAARARRESQAPTGFVDVVEQQLGVLQSTVDGQLRRARLAAQVAAQATGIGRRSTQVAPVLKQLLAVMQKLYVERGLTFEVDMPDARVCFTGESQDLVEMLGNLLDNAAKWAHHRVCVQVNEAEKGLVIAVHDDGPGIEPAKMAAVVERGTRLDEQVKGSGLGLAIARELVGSYGGVLALSDSHLGGLCAELRVPGGTKKPT